MKHVITILCALSFVTIAFSQKEYINYKAVIQDGSGNIVPNQSVGVQFEIRETTSTGTAVYTETHSTTTDANGILILDIGEGTTTDDFSGIDWGSANHFLNVKMDITGGTSYTDLGTTEFKSVPYALNVSGLERITEGGSTGWRLLGRDPADFGNIGNNAVDLSNQNTMPNVGATGSSAFASGRDTYSSGWGSASFGVENVSSGTGSIVGGFDSLATGDHSLAVGNNATASGNNSVSFGSESTASGTNSVAMGDNSIASGENSTAIGGGVEATGGNSLATGQSTIASGENSTAIGSGTKAESLNSVAIGLQNIGGGNASTWVSTDPLFEIGNGLTAPSNALTVLKNGTITAPSLTNTLINTAGSKALITKEYADALSSSGLQRIDQGFDPPGWTLPGGYLDGGFVIGPGIWSVDLVLHEELIGPGFNQGTGVSGDYSFGVGRDNAVIGNYAAGFGGYNGVEGEGSTVFGYGNWSYGDYVFIHGNGNENSADFSSAFGNGLEVDSFHSTALGRYNVGGGSASTWVDTDPIFEIGNGTDGANRSNSLTILKNGTITAPSLTNTLIETAGAKALVTKEYVDATGGSGLTLVTESTNTGWRLETNPDLDGGQLAPIGNKAIDMTIHDDGFWSFAGASGDFSFVVNKDNYATGAYSSAFGISSRVTGAASISAGNMGDVSGNSSFGFGGGLQVSADDATAVGEYNFDDTNAAFMVGNGTFSSRSNAMTVLKNGNTTINGQTTVSESTASATVPAIKGIKSYSAGSFDVAGVYGENIVAPFYGYGVHGAGNWIGVLGESERNGVRGLSNASSSGNHIGVYGEATGTNSGTNYGVYGIASSGSNNYAVYASGDLVYTGNLVDASDRKLKTNVDKIGNVTEAISSLNPSRYFIKESYQRSMNMSNKPEYGFIAQELQVVFPDLVSKNVHPGATKEAEPIEYLGVNYIGLIPILTKGIQEQQEQIENLKNKLESQEQTIALLIERIEALENN